MDDCAAFLDRSIILLLSSLTSGLLLMIATVIGTFLVWLYHALAASSFFEHLSLSKKNPRLSLFRHFSGTFSRFCVGSFSGLFGQFWSRTFQLFTYSFRSVKTEAQARQSKQEAPIISSQSITTYHHGRSTATATRR